MSGPATNHDPWLELPAPAKLNLALAVRHPTWGAPHPRGLHEITSWVHLIELGGRVRLRSATESCFAHRWADDATTTSPIDWPAESDLVWRAHRAMESHVGGSLPTEIEVIKRVPVGGGLGGGSSEAAAALLGLDRLHSLGLSPPELRSLGLALGSDVALFLPTDDGQLSVSAIVSGHGETIESATAAQAGVVLVLPPFGCETAAVYRAFDALDAPRWRPDAVRGLPGMNVLEAPLFNDLAVAAARAYPAMAAIDAAVGRAGRPCYQTGSGSAQFVLCPLGEVEAVIEALKGPAEAAGAVLVGSRLAPDHTPA